MKTDGYLTGRFRGKAYIISVRCCRKTASMELQLRAADGTVIPLTQNLGSAMPPYQVTLADGLVGPGNEDFTEYLEENDLGYIADYKRFDYSVFTGQPRRIAVVFQFNPRRLRALDPMGCRQYEKHNAKLLRRLFETQKSCRKAG